MKIAPTLEMLVASIDKTYWHKPDADSARAELRALLAVARAAQECDYINGSQPGPIDTRLRKALSRLDKVSHD